MIFRHALKAMVSRFSLIWSILLYSFLVLVVVSGLCITMLLPLYNAITSLESFGVLSDAANSFAIGAGVFEDILTSASGLYTDVINQIAGYSWSLILSIVVVVVVGRFLLGLMELPLAECVHARLTANAKLSFPVVFISTLNKSSVFQLSKMMFTVPYDLIMFFVTYFTAKLFSYNAFIALLSPMVVILEICAFFAFKSTLFGCWQAFVVVKKDKIFDAMRSGVRMCFADFARVFSLMFITIMLAIALVVFSLALTLGAGLVIAFPVVYLFHCILCMIIFYTNSGQRFYVDTQTVISPPKDPNA